MNDLMRVATRLSLVLLGLASLPLAAETIEPFPRAEVVNERDIRSPSHRIMLSPVREVNNEIRSRSVARLSVSGKGQLLEIDRSSGRDDARDYYQRELSNLNAVTLFECRGRGCGRSNVWANQIFNVASLYGRDGDQDYLAAAYRDAQGMVRVVLVYTVTRGNQREYAWVEQLSAGQNAVLPGFNTESARIQGPLVVPYEGGVTYSFDWNATSRQQLQDWAGEAGTEIILNSYSSLGDSESIAAALDRAESAADAMLDLLDKLGIENGRVTPVIIGPAVAFENPGRQGERVELMVVGAPQ